MCKFVNGLISYYSFASSHEFTFPKFAKRIHARWNRVVAFTNTFFSLTQHISHLPRNPDDNIGEIEYLRTFPGKIHDEREQLRAVLFTDEIIQF